MEYNDVKYGAIAIDTSILEACNYNLEKGILTSLFQFKDSNIKIILPEIVYREAIKRISERYDDAKTRIGKAIDLSIKTFYTEGRDCDRARDILISKEQPIQIAERIMKKFISRTNAIVISFDSMKSFRPILDNYFACRPPFQNKKNKKNEFPDAISLFSLEQWAIDNSVCTVVVSKDEDWLEYAKQSKWLSGFRNLEKAISCFLPNNAVAILKEKINAHLTDKNGKLNLQIEKELKEYILGLDLSTRASCFFEYENISTHTEMCGYSFNEKSNGIFDIDVLEFSGTETVFAIPARVAVHVLGHFLFYTYDSSNSQYNDYWEETIEKDENLEVRIVVYCGDLNVEKGKLIVQRIENFTNMTSVNFGKIEPSISQILGK